MCVCVIDTCYTCVSVPPGRCTVYMNMVYITYVFLVYMLYIHVVSTIYICMYKPYTCMIRYILKR